LEEEDLNLKVVVLNAKKTTIGETKKDGQGGKRGQGS